MPDTTYQQRAFDRATFRETVGEIQSAVAAEFGISVDAMTSGCRSRVVCRPRHVAMYLVRELTAAKLLRVGRLFGRRDHTTVINSVRRVTSLMADNDAFRERVEALRVRLSGEAAICPVYAVGLAARRLEAV